MIVKVEDVTKEFPYEDESFDFVYSRLCIPYLLRDGVKFALKEIFRILKLGGKFYFVVRGKMDRMTEENSYFYNEETGYTHYKPIPGEDAKRYFFTEELLREHLEEFEINYVKTYEEHLSSFYDRRNIKSFLHLMIECFAKKLIHPL